MTRETKIGLLLGLGVILLIGIIVSDHLAVVDQPVTDPLLTFGDAAQNSIRPADSLARGDAMPERMVFRSAPVQPIPTPQELMQRQQPSRPAAPLNLEDFPPAPSLRDLPRGRSSDSEGPGLVAEVGPRNPLADVVRDLERFTPAPAVAIASEAPASVQRFTEQAVSSSHSAEPQALPPAYHASALAPQVKPQPEPGARRQAPADVFIQIQHTVLEGENLTTIAHRYYGDGKLWPTIAKANPTVVDARGRVRAGARLLIPSVQDLARSGAIHALAEPRSQLERSSRRASEPATIRVESGDLLGELAARHLGSSRRWPELLEANRDQLEKPESLRVGMVLRLPVSAGTAATAAAGADRLAAPAPAAASSLREYRVRSGDTLIHIAQRELGDGERWAEIYQANRDRLESPDRLIVGRQLRIPG